MKLSLIIFRVGITGNSPLWRLHALYGFDLSLDLVFDGMHCISLNIFKKYVEEFINTYGKTASDRAKIEKALSIVHAARLKTMAGRWPQAPTTRLKFFKAEEYQLYIMWCLHYTMTHIKVDFSSKLIHIGLVLVNIGRLYYSYSRTHGWSINDINIARDLFKVWRKLSIEHGGQRQSVLEHVVGAGHLMDDILRHGPQDVYWCYKFEREVSAYMRTSRNTNHYLYDVSFALYYTRILFTNTTSQINHDSDGLYPEDRALLLIHSKLQESSMYLFPVIDRGICTE